MILIKKSKCLKIAKMGLVSVLALVVLILPTSALYAESGVNTPLYNSPIKFNFSTYTGVDESYVTELTPTIRYTSGGTPATELVQSSYYYDSNIDYDNYIGTWTFVEPLEDIGSIVDDSDDVTYSFTFTYKINNTGEVIQCYGMRIRRIMGTDDGISYYVIYYLRDLNGSNQIVAYRSKYGEFAQNSYQTIEIQSEPPAEIKQLLNTNGLRVDGNYGETITYDNFSINTTIENGVLSVSYNLNAPTLSNIDGIKIKITADSGYLNPNLSSLPFVTLPENVSAVVNGSYRVYDISGSYVDYTITNRNIAKGGILTLFSVNSIPPNYCYITNYDMTIELLVEDEEQPAGEWGDAGFYQWLDKIPYYSDWLYEVLTARVSEHSDFYYSGVSLPAGSMVNGTEISALYLMIDNGGSADDRDSIFYEIASNGENVMVYDFDTEEWFAFSFDGEEYIWTVETVKTMYINGSLSEITDVEQYGNTNLTEAFLPWFETASVYTSGPIFNGSTNGVNKTYLFTVDYSVLNESLNKSTVRGFMSDYYSSVFSRGYNSNTGGSQGVDYTSWLADSVGGFLDFELFPNFSLGGLLGILISFAVVVLFLKFFAGG